MPESDSPLAAMVSAIAPFETFDLLRRVGGLQLIAENQSRLVRLTALAFAASCSIGSSSRASHNRLRQLVNSAPLPAALAPLEDQAFGPFSEEVVFHGGGYVVLPGLLEHATFITRSLCMGLFMSKVAFPDQAFATEASDRLRALLTLSRTIASRAGIPRNLPAIPPADGVFVPGSSILRRLASAVTFSNAEVCMLLATHRLPTGSLSPFVTSVGEYAEDEYLSPDDNPIISTPLVAFPEGIIVASPTDLLSAWIRWLHAAGRSRDLADVIAGRYLAAVGAIVDHDLTTLLTCSRRPEGLPSPTPPGDGWSDMIYAYDSDKALHVVVAADDFRIAADRTSVWDSTRIAASISQRMHDVVHRLYSTPLLNELLHVVVVSGTGRATQLTIPTPYDTSNIMIVHADELRCIAHFESGNSQCLRQFITALDRNKHRLHFMSILDAFATYRGRDHSFYIDDERPTTLFVIQPDSGNALHCEMLSARDYHGARTPEGTITEVTRTGAATAPIYFAPAALQFGLLVEGYSIPIWISLIPDGNEGISHTAGLLLDAIAFWLWTFTPALSDLFTRIAKDTDCFQVAVGLAPDEDWSRPLIATSPMEDLSVDSLRTTSLSRSHIAITVRPSLVDHLGTSDNAGERSLVRWLIQTIGQTLPSMHRPNETTVGEWLQTHAPLGPKKMFHVFSSEMLPTLRPAARGRPRLVQQSDTATVFDDVGDYLRSVGHRPRYLDSKSSVQTLNAAVDYLLNRIAHRIATLERPKLLEHLIRINEQLLYSRDHHATSLASRLACYGDASDLAERYASEHAERTRMSRATRFLIEYVAACPPRGIRGISASVLDELIALASVLISYGDQSDLIYTGLASSVRLLESGRIGVDLSVVDARTAHLTRWASGEISRSMETDAAVSSDEAWRVWQLFIDACEDEFGFSFQDGRTVADVATDLADDNATVAVMPAAQFIEIVGERGDIPSDKAKRVVEAMSLTRRSDFLSPPPPFKRRDVYPWIHNRGLSYARRPFIRRSSNGVDEFVWGPAHVSGWTRYFSRIVLSDRLKATTDKMRIAVGEAVHLASSNFVALVSQAFHGESHWCVRTNVSKLPGVRLPQRLGDFDVLAVSPSCRRIVALECKNLEVARNPRELANEIQKLIGPRHDKPPAVERHHNRLRWLHTHWREVCQSMSVPTGGRWRLAGYIVTNMELFGPSLVSHVKVSIISLAEFRSLLASDSIRWTDL